MANVGEKTGKKTQAGRDVYETPEGEMVSENLQPLNIKVSGLIFLQYTMANNTLKTN